MSTFIKDGVEFVGIKPELMVGLWVLYGVFEEMNEDLVLTSVVDSKHGRGSLHYAGLACDIRSNSIPLNVKTEILKMGRERLGPNFDFILEHDHYHLEYQPK